jgi:DNA-binding PadR family transcriptional regulator
LAWHARSDDPQDARCHGPLHGYLIARRIEQISDGQLSINQGTIYPALLKLRHRAWITKWGESDTGRRVKFYAITPRGQAPAS